MPLENVPFVKAHGDGNDFLVTWTKYTDGLNLETTAQAICARSTGVGADGWILLSPTQLGLSMRLFNSDGSEPEVSGNGIRCAVAVGLMDKVVRSSDEIIVETAAGPKMVRVIKASDKKFHLETNMGSPRVEELSILLSLRHGEFEATILNVGNPQCAIFVEEFPEDWRQIGADVVHHERFPNGSNVSFVRVINAHTIEALFFERGAGETLSSGTGSIGASVAAILRGVARSPVSIRTMGGSLNMRWEKTIYLDGPAELIAKGNFLLEV